MSVTNLVPGREIIRFMHSRSESSSTDRLKQARRAFHGSTSMAALQHSTRFFWTRCLQQLSTVLLPHEISAILAADGLREEGLAHCHGGDFDAAALCLDRAAALCADASLSHRARVAGLSFGLAAEAYLRYRRGDVAGAVADLEGAIIATVELESLFGHAMEFRRVHLARNILRTQAGSAPATMIASRSIALLLHIGGDKARWPLTVGKSCAATTRMPHDERACAIDELLTNLVMPGFDTRVVVDYLYVLDKGAGLDPLLRAAVEWCWAMIYHQLGNRPLFLDRVTRFFETKASDLVDAAKLLDDILEDIGVEIE